MQYPIIITIFSGVLADVKKSTELTWEEDFIEIVKNLNSDTLSKENLEFFCEEGIAELANDIDVYVYWLD